MVARGEDCEVRLEESDSGALPVLLSGMHSCVLTPCVTPQTRTPTGELFALCPVNPGSVERTEDSRRYFVLRVEDGSGA